MHANIANFVRQDVRVSKRKPLLPVFELLIEPSEAISILMLVIRRRARRVLVGHGAAAPPPRWQLVGPGGIGKTRLSSEVARGRVRRAAFVRDLPTVIIKQRSRRLVA